MILFVGEESTGYFVEEVAKNKFGLLYPDEILIKPDD